MALYVYKALTKTGKQVAGQLDAPSPVAVRVELSSKNLYPISIDLYKDSSTFKKFFGGLFQPKVAFKDLIFFTKQLGVMLRSGVPLLEALELLTDQFTGKLHSILVSVKDGIKEGSSLADGLENYPETFSTIYVQLVRAGEASGRLEQILDRLVDYLERREILRKKISGAMFQPLFQLSFVILIVMGLMVAIVPNMVKVIGSMAKGGLPTSTVILMTMSDFLINHYALLGQIILLVLFIFIYWSSTKNGQYTIDYLKLHIPLVGYFSQMSAVVQFCSTLGMLLENGVNLAQALDIVCNIIENKILLDSLETAKEKIIKQGKISSFLKETKIFPPLAIYLINTGEQNGKLDQMLLLVAKNYDEDLSELTDRLTSSLGPIMTIVMGVVVGFVMMAIMGPMLNMYSSSNF
ncbi:type II secretion system F family protein [Candidatus Babeliales bacterium]|nr:type II secretion system F family protein [Candidatus Babeliales bacterium]MBP9844167.1 type II secretion system F family protein [Candidatus Babeliales bacterium]